MENKRLVRRFIAVLAAVLGIGMVATAAPAVAAPAASTSVAPAKDWWWD